jgi:hypothetical protein
MVLRQASSVAGAANIPHVRVDQVRAADDEADSSSWLFRGGFNSQASDARRIILKEKRSRGALGSVFVGVGVHEPVAESIVPVRCLGDERIGNVDESHRR